MHDPCSPASSTDLAHLDDHALLAGGVDDLVAENQAHARLWSRMLALHDRRAADHLARRAEEPHFTLTPRQETVVEVGELWSMDERWVRSQLNIALFLRDHLPRVWQLCQTGQLDRYRATLIADTARHALDSAPECARLAERLAPFLDRHLTSPEGLLDAPAVVRCTVKQLRNKLTYELALLRSQVTEDRWQRAYADRTVQAQDGEDGMGSLWLSHSVDRIRLAEHRLDRAARQLRSGGDERTLEQLRADLALDLLTGAAAQADVPIPAFARPVINLTVPVQTLLGLTDHPGVLSGGTVLPASLVREIAQRPGATWHRMLTDPAGGTLELSTRSYQPTAPIWRRVVAEQPTCFRPGCDRPATGCELDHVVPWPQGPTTAENLQPACKSDHKAKHAPGFGILATPDGSRQLRTPAGFQHPVLTPTHPVSADWPDPEQIQSPPTERRPERPDLDWEHGEDAVLLHARRPVA
jgi:Domain of unknown function (DUF222)/HNH endonuclease